MRFIIETFVCLVFSIHLYKMATRPHTLKERVTSNFNVFRYKIKTYDKIISLD